MPQGDTLAEPTARRRLLDLAGVMTTPLLPDDYLTAVNPLWAFSELRGRIEQIIPRTREAATIVIRPGRRWPGHRAGQHLALGVDVDGVRHWRSYSLTSDPRRPDGCISVTVKAVDGGTVSSHLVYRAAVGDLIRLGPPEGEFVLPRDAGQRPMLFITAGSGITPVMSMLRELESAGALGDVVHVHSERTADQVIFGPELRRLADEQATVVRHERHTHAAPRLAPTDLDELCPDWRERDTYACGPMGLLDAVEAHYAAAGLTERLAIERFEIALIGADPGDGGTATIGDLTFESAAGVPLLVSGEDAGLVLRSGCRMGICHTCVCTLVDGQARDLRTGELIRDPGADVQLCVSAAAGDLTLQAAKA
ncbi:MAG: ferredoxin reductase [Solirubrobacteraceae bacterium]|nr:ferredoxin reductase [Solirubrobacteraceae bacterium]